MKDFQIKSQFLLVIIKAAGLSIQSPYSQALETIDFKRTPDQLTHAADFLRDHANRVKRKGDQLLVDGVRHREIKLLLHKFLRHQGLNGYRILS